MAEGVERLKQLLFQKESATLADLEQRIALVAEAEQQARSQLAEGLAQLENIRRVGERGRELQSQLEQRLASLNARTGTPQALRASVAEIIDEAIVDARETKQADLSRALAPMLVKTIKAELKNNQAEMVEALYPITGQLVKAYVASAMRDLTNRMNRGLQSNGFMLRLRSMFSGYSTTELRLAETQRLEVEELYLIRRGSGELVERFPRSLERSNSDAHMGGVLAAINDFAATTFKDEGGHLRSFDVDDFTLFLRASPVYLLAAKCRGIAAPGVEHLIDSRFLEAVALINERTDIEADDFGTTRVLAEVKTGLESGIADKHEELASAGMPFSPVRALAMMAVLAFVVGGGWYAWTVWEVERTRQTARQAIAETQSLNGYPVGLEVGQRGHSISISGLLPNEFARSDLMQRLVAALPGVAIVDKGIVALPAQGPDLAPAIASVRTDVGNIRTSVRQEVQGVEATMRKEVQSVETAMRQEVETVRRLTERNAALRSLETARGRLQDMMADLATLAGLKDSSRQGPLIVARRAGEGAIASLGKQTVALRDGPSTALENARAAQAIAEIASTLRHASAELSGLVGNRPAATAAKQQPVGSARVDDAAEAVSLAAERLATVAAATLQAASIRIPPPPQIVPPSAIERLRAYAARNAIFFSNLDEFRDATNANAVLDEIARLAKDARALIRVVGYTDERGGVSRNSQIAQQRADKIAQALLARGVPRALVVSVGRSSGPDLSPTSGPDSANRRAEFEIGFEHEPRAAP